MPEKPLILSEEDFIRTLMDFQMYKQNIDYKHFKEKISNAVLYSGKVSSDESSVYIKLTKGDTGND